MTFLRGLFLFSIFTLFVNSCHMTLKIFDKQTFFSGLRVYCWVISILLYLFYYLWETLQHISIATNSALVNDAWKKLSLAENQSSIHIFDFIVINSSYQTIPRWFQIPLLPGGQIWFGLDVIFGMWPIVYACVYAPIFHNEPIQEDLLLNQGRSILQVIFQFFFCLKVSLCDTHFYSQKPYL